MTPVEHVHSVGLGGRVIYRPGRAANCDKCRLDDPDGPGETCGPYS